MDDLRNDEMEISDETMTFRMKILFTCNKGDQEVVFFYDEKNPEEVQCAFYDDKGNLDPLSEEDYAWANEVLESWQKEQDKEGD